MKLSLVEELYLIALDDDTGTLVSGASGLTYGMSGAIVLDLALRGHIGITEKKVTVINTDPTGDPLQDRHLEIINNSKKERSLQYWIEYFSPRYVKIKNEVIQSLLDKGIIQKEPGKVLWFIPVTRYPAQNARPENELRKELIRIVIDDHAPELKHIMLLNLLVACNLVREVFGKDREKKKLEERIKRISARFELSTAVRETISQIHETIAIVLTLTTTTTIVTST